MLTAIEKPFEGNLLVLLFNDWKNHCWILISFGFKSKYFLTKIFKKYKMIKKPFKKHVGTHYPSGKIYVHKQYTL